jgi:hypothetical protein
MLFKEIRCLHWKSYKTQKYRMQSYLLLKQLYVHIGFKELIILSFDALQPNLLLKSFINKPQINKTYISVWSNTHFKLHSSSALLITLYHFQTFLQISRWTSWAEIARYVSVLSLLSLHPAHIPSKPCHQTQSSSIKFRNQVSLPYETKGKVQVRYLRF